MNTSLVKLFRDEYVMFILSEEEQYYKKLVVLGNRLLVYFLDANY